MSVNEKAPCRRRAPRRPLPATVEFVCDFDVLPARGIDVSATGISFSVEAGLVFEMRYEIEGQRHQHRCELVRVQPEEGGGYRCGFRFLADHDETKF